MSNQRDLRGDKPLAIMFFYLQAFPFQCNRAIGMALTATIKAIAIPVLPRYPTFSSICGNLDYCQYTHTSRTQKTYQNGPMNPHVCRTNVINTPTLAASDR